MGLCTSRRSVAVPSVTITQVKEAPPSPRPARLTDNGEGLQLPQASTLSLTRSRPKKGTPHLSTFGDGPASRSLAASLERTASLRESLCQPGPHKPTRSRPRQISSLLSSQSNPRLLHPPPSPSPLSSSSTFCIRDPRWRAIKTSSYLAFSSSTPQLSGPSIDHLPASRREAENAGAFCKVMTINPAGCFVLRVYKRFLKLLYIIMLEWCFEKCSFTSPTTHSILFMTLFGGLVLALL